MKSVRKVLFVLTVVGAVLLTIKGLWFMPQNNDMAVSTTVPQDISEKDSLTQVNAKNDATTTKPKLVPELNLRATSPTVTSPAVPKSPASSTVQKTVAKSASSSGSPTAPSPIIVTEKPLSETTTLPAGYENCGSSYDDDSNKTGSTDSDGLQNIIDNYATQDAVLCISKAIISDCKSSQLINKLADKSQDVFQFSKQDSICYVAMPTEKVKCDLEKIWSEVKTSKQPALKEALSSAPGKTMANLLFAIPFDLTLNSSNGRDQKYGCIDL